MNEKLIKKEQYAYIRAGNKNLSILQFGISESAYRKSYY